MRSYFCYAFYQAPVVPLQRPDEMHIPTPSWMQTTSGFEDMSNEQGIPTMITWSYDAKEVFVEGSWDDWKTRYKLMFPLWKIKELEPICCKVKALFLLLSGNRCKDQVKTSLL